MCHTIVTTRVCCECEKDRGDPKVKETTECAPIKANANLKDKNAKKGRCLGPTEKEVNKDSRECNDCRKLELAANAKRWGLTKPDNNAAGTLMVPGDEEARKARKK